MRTSLKILSAFLLLIIIVAFYNRNGKVYYQFGLVSYKLADHGDYHDQTGLKRAIVSFEKAITIGYKERLVFEKLAFSYLLLNQDRKNAERIYTLGLAKFPNDFEFYFRRGICRKELKMYKASFLDFDKVIVRDTLKKFEYFKDAIYERGAMRYMNGDKVNAEKDRAAAQQITSYPLRTYEDYCQLWK